MTHRIGSFMAIALAVTLVAGRAALGADGGATPEAVFDNFKAAMKDKDFKKGFQQTTPDSQELVLGGMAIGMSFMPATDATKGQEVDALLQKHGIKKPDLSNPAAMQDPKALMKQMVGDVKDKPAAIAELLAYMEKTLPPDQQDAATKADAFADSTLSDVKVEGDSASGTIKVSSGGQEQTQPIMFKKVGEVWFVDFAALADKTMQQQGQGAAPGAMPQ